MRLLITGGAGFIGSNFVRYILGKYPEYQVINLDKLTYAGNLDNLADIADNPNYSFVEGDIADRKFIKTVGYLKCDPPSAVARECYLPVSLVCTKRVET